MMKDFVAIEPFFLYLTLISILVHLSPVCMNSFLNVQFMFMKVKQYYYSTLSEGPLQLSMVLIPDPSELSFK